MKQLAFQTSKAYLQPGASLLSVTYACSKSYKNPINLISMSYRSRELLLFFLLNRYLVISHCLLFCGLHSSLTQNKNPRSVQSLATTKGHCLLYGELKVL